MALRKNGQYWYGDGPNDVWEYFVAWTKDSGEPVKHWKQAVCRCKNKVFQVDFDEEPQYLERYCTKCERDVVMFADEFADVPDDPDEEEPNPDLLECICGKDHFEVIGVTAPFTTDPDDNSARTFYLGLRCVACGCLGCYTSWHPRYNDHKAFLALL
jgi:hypothetical protein